jgi:hypothetical protein
MNLGRYALVTKKLNDKSAESKEQLVFDDLKAMEPVKKEDKPAGYKGHNMHLFTVEKYLADGSHDKYKSRLVAHGNKQDSTNYADRSALMVEIQSLMACLTLAACNIDCLNGKPYRLR